METFKILKLKRKYAEIQFENGFKADLLICDKVKNFELNKDITIALEDISISSRYGKKWIFKLKKDAEEVKEYTFLKSDYNKILVNECNKLGGKWDAKEKLWVFPKFIEDKVEELDLIFNSEKITIELTAKSDIYKYYKAVTFLGIKLAIAFSRDSGAKICENISFLNRDPQSGGSRANWATIILAEG